MKILIKITPVSSKTDENTDQDTWILISVNTKYSIFAASVITYNNNRATYILFSLRHRYISCTVLKFSFLENNTPNSIPKTVHFKIADFLATSITNFDNQ